MKKILIIIILFLYIGVVNSEIVEASWAERWKPFVELAVEEKYDSNIFLDPDGIHRPGHTKSDFVTIFTPAFGLDSETEKQQLKFKYELNYSLFINNSNQNYLGHTVLMEFSRYISRHFRFYMRDNVNVSEEPQTTNYEYVSVNYGRRRNLNNSGEIGLEYWYGPENRIKFYYRDDRIIYLNKEKKGKGGKYSYDDSQTYGPGLEFEYWFTKRHGFWVIYEWIRTDYQIASSQKRDHLELAYNYRFSPKTLASIIFSYDYSDSKGKDEFDYEIYQITAGFEKVININWSYSLFAGYYYRPSGDLPDILDNSSDNDGFAGGLTITYSREHWDLSFSAEAGIHLEYGDYNNRGYTPYRSFAIYYSREFLQHLKGYVDLLYSYENSPDTLVGFKQKNNRRETYEATVGINYLIRPWLEIDTEYSYSKESATSFSRHYPAGYTDHIFLIRITARKDWFKTTKK